jgi:hypothetical protein
MSNKMTQEELAVWAQFVAGGIGGVLSRSDGIVTDDTLQKINLIADREVDAYRQRKDG